jgi:lysophospholipase L1-like esterase
MAQALEAFCEEQGIILVDLKPVLVARAEALYGKQGEVLYWSDDTHWNPRGHAVVAEYLHQHVIYPAK